MIQIVSAMLGTLCVLSVPAIAGDCPICDRQVVFDRKLAACFLDRYDVLTTSDGGAVAVDLSDCPDPVTDSEEQERGVIEALKMPEKAQIDTPDPTFMITHVQMQCLKQHLADDALVLDPAAAISLDDCE